jgi:hypothetical protein
MIGVQGDAELGGCPHLGHGGDIHREKAGAAIDRAVPPEAYRLVFFVSRHECGRWR